VIEAASTWCRLNPATVSRSAQAYPPQLYRAVTSLPSGVDGPQRTFGQLAARLDALAADSRVGHDVRREDPALR
jgi:hypothetical protein